MRIRKLFKFENAHIVRGCSTQRCRASIHGHSYTVEVFLTSDVLDHGQMVYDFGLMKGGIKSLIDSFDHAITLWDEDDSQYIASMQRHSQRWVLLPISPSCEQFSRVFFLLIDRLLTLTTMVNGESNVTLESVIVHETLTGYAQSFREDAYSSKMGVIDLDRIIFSDEIVSDWGEMRWWTKLKEGGEFRNPTTV